MANHSTKLSHEMQQELQGSHSNSAGDGLGTMDKPDRHVGCVRKLLSTYGFIQYGERNLQVFFHYSAFNGTVEELAAGDQVEFQVVEDGKSGSGRTLAVDVVKVTHELNQSAAAAAMGSSVGSPGAGGDKDFRGTVMLGAKRGDANREESFGRLSYEQNGECFYIPFSHSDAESSVKEGDLVSFSINSGTGEMRAVNVRRLRFQGVVCSLKENFGFIERADVVREIFFHYSEFNGDVGEIVLGDDVEYEIQIRNNKEVAVDVSCLPAGTVIFDDLQVSTRRGKIKKAPRGGPKKGGAGAGRGMGSPGGPQSSPTQDGLPGVIVYNTIQDAVEIQFGDKDVNGDYTLFAGDVVNFQIATDRRDGLQRAVNVTVQAASFALSKEIRRQGVVCSLKETYGFIRKVSGEGNIFFHFSELIKADDSITIGDEVQFTSASDNSGRSSREMALRIVRLPRGTIQYNDPASSPSMTGQGQGFHRSSLRDDSKYRDYREQLPPGTPGSLQQSPGEVRGQGSSGGQREAQHRIKEYCGLVVSSRGCEESGTAANGQAVPLEVREESEASMNGSNNAAEPSTNGVHAGDSPRTSGGDGSAEGTASGEVVIEYFDDEGKVQTIGLSSSLACGGAAVKAKDRVTFNISDTEPGSPRSAVNVQVKDMGEEKCGYVAVVKDSYGFIESVDLTEEVFFHFSSCDDQLEAGNAVRFVVEVRGKRMSAERVRKVTNHDFLETPSEGAKELIHGKVIRSLKVWNNDQLEYCGLIEGDPTTGQGEPAPETPAPIYRFGVFSLAHRDHVVTVGEHVQFEARRGPAGRPTSAGERRQSRGGASSSAGNHHQGGNQSAGANGTVAAENTAMFAVNLAPSTANPIMGRVESIKGQYGFIEYKSSGQTVYFHVSDVLKEVAGSGGAASTVMEGTGVGGLEVDDHVSFVVMQSQRSNKPAAVSVQKLQQARPERLINRLKQPETPTGPRLTILRQPRQPHADGSKGFDTPRVPQ